MAITTQLKLGNAIEHIAKSIENELENQIKAALMPHAEKVIEEAAKKLCENLKTNMISYRDYENNEVKIALVIDGARHEI